MPLVIPSPLPVPAAGMPLADQANPSLTAIEASGSRLYQWYDTILTDGAGTKYGSSMQWKDMWEERSSRLILENNNAPAPTLGTIGNGKNAINIVNVGTAYVVLGASDSSSLIIPDATQWSVLVAVRPTDTSVSILLGPEIFEPVTVSDYGLYLQFTDGLSKTQWPRLMNGNATVTRIADSAHEYANIDSVLAIGFDTTNGLTMSRNGTIVTTAPADTHALTSTKFQIGGIGSGISSLNYNGYIGALLTYRVNIFAAENQDLHRAAVKSYCDALDLDHPF